MGRYECPDQREGKHMVDRRSDRWGILGCRARPYQRITEATATIVTNQPSAVSTQTQRMSCGLEARYDPGPMIRLPDPAKLS